LGRITKKKQRKDNCSYMTVIKNAKIDTIISLIIICPWIVCLDPSSENPAVQSFINCSLRFPFLTDHTIWRKSIIRLLELLRKLILRALTDATISKPTHSIIRPKGAVTP
jgi:hypothetical protein